MQTTVDVILIASAVGVMIPAVRFSYRSAPDRIWDPVATVVKFGAAFVSILGGAALGRFVLPDFRWALGVFCGIVCYLVLDLLRDLEPRASTHDDRKAT